MRVYGLFVKQIWTQLVLVITATLCFGGVALSQSATTGTVNRDANLRSGPGTNYTIIGKAASGQAVTLVDENDAGSWYQLAEGQWIASFLVNLTTGTPLPAPTNAAATGATAQRAANLRAGPGVNYAVTGVVRSGQALELVGANADRSWLQLANGAWIAAFLVNQAAAGPATTVPAASVVPVATATPTTIPAPTGNGNHFVLVQKRLWDVIENGGSLDGPSVHCGLARELLVNVLDANGNRLNGVAVQVEYGARETVVTGSQGKGDGVAEFVLGGGQDVKVIRDVGGAAVTSDVATSLSTNPQNIPYEALISAQYCQDEASCQSFVAGNACNGHFSWTVTFQRQR